MCKEHTIVFMYLSPIIKDSRVLTVIWDRAGGGADSLRRSWDARTHSHMCLRQRNERAAVGREHKRRLAHAKKDDATWLHVARPAHELRALEPVLAALAQGMDVLGGASVRSPLRLELGTGAFLGLRLRVEDFICRTS